MKKIGVVGGGLMGLGIASVFCRNDYPVYLYEPLEAQQKTIYERMLTLLVSDGYPASHADNLNIIASISQFPKDTFVIFEAGPEKLEVKQKIFNELTKVVSKETILASNTSVIPITQISEGTLLLERNRIIGTHWWNPANLIPLVEVIRTEYSTDRVLNETYDLLSMVGKQPVYVEKDITGFIGNRLQHALWREAQFLIGEGVCSPETIDIVVKNSFGMRLPVFGPIENADMVGLDLTLDIHNVILKDLCNATKPLPALMERIDANKLGVKTGEGFLSWTVESKTLVQTKLNEHIRAMLKNDR